MAAFRINRCITWCLVVAAAIFAVGSAVLMFVATDARLTADIELSKTSLMNLHNNLYEAATGYVLGTGVGNGDGNGQGAGRDGSGDQQQPREGKEKEERAQAQVQGQGQPPAPPRP